MGIPGQFNDIIQRHLNVWAAWLPITNNYSLGDYGIISNGVFAKMGNISEFGIPIIPEEGREASIDFTSSNATVAKFAGGAQVNVIPAGSVDAKVAINFENEKSFVVKAPVIKVTALKNVNQVAQKLKGESKWGKKWKVVYQVYEAIDPLIVSTLSPSTEIILSGDAEALRSLKMGSASVELSTNKELGLNVHGKNGVIGLGLFRLKHGPDPRFLAGGEPFTTDFASEDDLELSQ